MLKIKETFHRFLLVEGSLGDRILDGLPLIDDSFLWLDETARFPRPGDQVNVWWGNGQPMVMPQRLGANEYGWSTGVVVSDHSISISSSSFNVVLTTT